jgi:hypothetical protein
MWRSRGADGSHEFQKYDNVRIFLRFEAGSFAKLVRFMTGSTAARRATIMLYLSHRTNCIALNTVIVLLHRTQHRHRSPASHSTLSSFSYIVFNTVIVLLHRTSTSTLK